MTYRLYIAYSVCAMSEHGKYCNVSPNFLDTWNSIKYEISILRILLMVLIIETPLSETKLLKSLTHTHTPPPHPWNKTYNKNIQNKIGLTPPLQNRFYLYDFINLRKPMVIITRTWHSSFHVQVKKLLNCHSSLSSFHVQVRKLFNCHSSFHVQVQN